MRRRMTARLVSPDRKLFLVAGEGDLRAVAELYNLTRQTERQHSASCSVATAAATTMTALSAKCRRTSRLPLHALLCVALVKKMAERRSCPPQGDRPRWGDEHVCRGQGTSCRADIYGAA